MRGAVKEPMFVAGAITISLLTGMIIIHRSLRNAPEGFEDASGFHQIGKSSAHLRGFQAGFPRIMRSLRPVPTNR
jgi:hypothetical protein